MYISPDAEKVALLKGRGLMRPQVLSKPYLSPYLSPYLNL
jgi:hypothetical protein